MTAQFDAKKADIKLEDDGIAIDWTTNGDGTLLLGHMGKGWSGQDWTGDAVEMNATIPATDADQVEFGFVQLARANRFEAFYAGRIASEGSIALNYFVAPALKQKILLDGSNKPRDPWYRNPTFGTSRNGRAAGTGDHPGLVVPLKIKNRVRSYVPNYLFHVVMDREFWTIFTARESNGKLTYLAYVQWQLVYEFKIRWSSGIPQRFTNRSAYRVIKDKTMGRPPDTDLQQLLDNPSGERANAIGGFAQKITESGTLPNRNDLESRFITIPEVFWS